MVEKEGNNMTSSGSVYQSVEEWQGPGMTNDKRTQSPRWWSTYDQERMTELPTEKWDV